MTHGNRDSAATLESEDDFAGEKLQLPKKRRGKETFAKASVTEEVSLAEGSNGHKKRKKSDWEGMESLVAQEQRDTRCKKARSRVSGKLLLNRSPLTARRPKPAAPLLLWL